MTDKEKMKEILNDYITGYTVGDIIFELQQAGFTRREKAKLIAPTYIQGRKFDKIYHCNFCGGIPYGGVGEDSRFCMVCGAEIEEIVGL